MTRREAQGKARSIRAKRMLKLVAAEYEKARKKHRPMAGAHEGYAVLLEEVDELWDEIKADNHGRAQKEAVQVAAMALALLVEVFP